LIVVFKTILSLFIKDPILFIKNLNIENIAKLRTAINQESPALISQNMSSYFDKSKTHPDEIDVAKVTKFVGQYKEAIDEKKEVILFIGHEATLTGAPLILLKAIEEIKKKNDILPVVILCKDGVLEKEYKKLGLVYTLPNHRNPSIDNKELDGLLNKVNDIKKISKAIFNSVESRRILKVVRKHTSKLTYLIHELGNLYPKNAWNIIDKNSDKIVFPAEFVKRKAIENNSFDLSKLSIQAQGLLKPGLLNRNKSEARKEIRDKLKLPSNAIIILGAGTGIPRKGIDFFTSIALSVLPKTEQPIYFIWLGEMPINDYKYWIEKDIEHSGYSDRILLLGEQKETENYFCASDLFLMTSRGDPFPCVVQEAVASGLFIIGYQNVGGFTDLIDQNNGVLLSYGDVHGAVEVILNKDWSEINSNLEAAKKKLNSMESYAEYLYNTLA